MILLLEALVGMVLGTSLDALHVATGTMAYKNPVLGLQDWWVPLEFAVAGILTCEGYRRIGVSMARVVPPPATLRELLLGVACFVLSYGSSGFFRAWPNAELAAYILLFIPAVLFTPKDARGALLLHSVTLAVGGPLTEAAISATGTFWYVEPDFLGVPRWLPGIYLHVGLASANLIRFLDGRMTGVLARRS